MIKIGLDEKIKAKSLTRKQFLESYCQSILEHNHNTYDYKKKRDRFDLGGKKNRSLKLHTIFLEWYIKEPKLKGFIDHIFTTTLASDADAKKLITRILSLSPQEIDTKVVKINSYAPYSADTRIKDVLSIIFNYKRDNDSRIRPRFMELDFSVCYYCNRNYINGFKLKNGKKAFFTLDHYFQKEKYPIFALSLYNLIPSCSSCNTNVKGTRDVEQYCNPYHPKYDFDGLSTFTLTSNNSARLSSSDPKCANYIRDFYLNEVYEHHRQEIEELVQKRRIFTDPMITNFSKITGLPVSQVKMLVFGKVINRNELDVEPLSKLKIDIAKQLGIIP